MTTAVRPKFPTFAASVGVLISLGGGLPARDPARPGKVAAVVNGEPLPVAQVDAILHHRPAPAVKESESEYRELQREAVELLIDDLLLQQFLRKNGPPVSAADVNRQLEELRASLRAQGETLEAYCRECGQTEAQLRETARTMLQRNAFIAKHLDGAAVRKYYEDNREFFDQVTVRVSHILLRPAPGDAASLAAAREKLRAVRAQVASGRLDFAAAAKTYSECTSAAGGGDIGFFPRKGAVEEGFARAAFALKPGEVSDVVQTSYGLHLIKVTDRRSGPPSDFKQIESTVRAFAGEQMMLEIVARERAAAKIEIKLGEEAAKPARKASVFGLR